MHLSRLARDEGAGSLIGYARAGGPARPIAVAALAYCSEAEPALRFLCGALGDGTADEGALRALHALLESPEMDREHPDPDAFRRCDADLAAYAGTPLGPAAADLVASSRQMVREHLPGTRPGRAQRPMRSK